MADGLTDRLFGVEQAAATWIRRSSRLRTSVTALACILLVGVIDGTIANPAGYDFVVTAFYIVPIGFAAWAVGLKIGVACAFFAGAVEAAENMWAARGALRPWDLAGCIALEILVFLVAAFTFARLRWYLEHHRQLSRTDALTSLDNARALEAAIEQEVARMGRRPAPVSVVYFDLDRFKDLNDSRGHLVGNEVLRLVGETVRASVRAVDSAARVGGDEFALLLPETGAEACCRVVERLRDRLNRTLKAGGFTNTFSVGAVTFEGTPESPSALLAAADRAMYHVKHNAGDGVHYEIVQGRTVPDYRRSDQGAMPLSCP